MLVRLRDEFPLATVEQRQLATSLLCLECLIRAVQRNRLDFPRFHFELRHHHHAIVVERFRRETLYVLWLYLHFAFARAKRDPRSGRRLSPIRTARAVLKVIARR